VGSRWKQAYHQRA